jgi:hypothetical protein
MAMSGVGRLASSVLPGSTQRQQLCCFETRQHVGEFERHSLELADLLTELNSGGGPFGGDAERSRRRPDAHRGDLQSRRAEPFVGRVEAAMLLTEDLRHGHTAVVEVDDHVVVAAVRHALVAVDDFATWRVEVDEESRDQLLRTTTGLLLAAGREENHVVARSA